ncbi:MAG: DUF4148 domain-containing protein [Burkholderiaceae bacterium]
MKFKLTLLALIAGASMVAQAQTPAASAPTRAEVKAETAAANKAGKIPNPDTAGSTVAKPAKSDKSRADVKAETAAANKGGALDKPDADGSGKVKAPSKGETKRADVKAEAAAANKAGTIDKDPGAPKK